MWIGIAYIATKPLIVHGKRLSPGKRIVGVKKHRLQQLVRVGKAEIINTEPIHYVALRELKVAGEIVKPGQEVTGISERILETMVRYKRVKEVPESEFVALELTPEEEMALMEPDDLTEGEVNENESDGEVHEEVDEEVHEDDEEVHEADEDVHQDDEADQDHQEDQEGIDA